jgi:hypothetical protein
MFNKEYCNYVYDFFNKDFFQKEMGVKLGKCTILTDHKAETKKIFRGLDVDGDEDPFGISITLMGHNYIWINPLLLNNKKILVNTLLHEMIHLYVNKVGNNGMRSYRRGHGRLWTQTAKYAQELYGDDLGNIERFATHEEVKKFNHYQEMKTTKTLVNSYLVKLVSGDLVPIKNLTDEQLVELQGMNIVGIFQVKPEIQQKPSTRVTKYIDWDTLVDCIENGIDYETEQVCGHLRIRLGEDTDTVWINKRR